MTKATDGLDLTRVGAGTLMGDLMRCYWIPALMSSELVSDGAPIRTPSTRGGCTEPPWEEDLLCLQNVWSYLQQGRWFRSIRSNGYFGLGGYQYYLGKSLAQRSVAIRFDPDGIALICQPEGSEETFRLAAQGVTKAELMGELSVLQALPIYQLALPFSLEAWRQVEYAHHLTGTTL